MNFIKASLKYRQVTLSVLLMVFVFGVNSLLNMPRREDPRITIPGGLIIAYYPGATPEQVEDQVTKKLEEYLFQFEEVRKEKTYSSSKEGMVVVHVWLKDNVKKPDIFWNKLRHQLMIVKAIELPQGVVGPMVNSDWGDTEAMVIGIQSKGASYAEIKECAAKLEDNIRAIPTASKIKRIGGLEEEISVEYSSEKLVQYSLNIQQLIKVLQAQNVVSPTGDLYSGDTKIPLRTAGYYKSMTDLQNQIVGTSRSGAVVRLGEIATITRKYKDPEHKITLDGAPAMLIAVQMHEGNNIVKFGKEVDETVARVSEQLPSNVKLVSLVNQPKMVDKNVSKFMHEFLLAIIAVILVVFMMLPISVAAVAATAIPMTISVTFAMLHILGIELHQVSLATLIVVLGMVVDDAIVIADNYVELLDRGHDRWTAAWRSATDLVVPILTATITIIAAFFPMVILTGAIGEFIEALPITVAIALSSSFVVAMFLTPLLCYLFIKKGLHSPEEKKKRRTLLDLMQLGYNNSIEWCVRNPKITIIGSLLTIVLAVVVFKEGVRHKFFPEAERNQFVVELWMPTGTKLDKTENAMLKVEELIKNDKRVVNYAAFIGQSAPRFYYNYSPEMPMTNFAQLLVNTTSDKTTIELFKELPAKIEPLVPDGSVEVKLMQQGQPLKAPVEVRIKGSDIGTLKKISVQVQDIIRNTEGSRFVRNDFREDYMGITIEPKNEANRLGFTTSNISQMVYAGLNGYPVTTLYDGDNPIDIVLRLGEQYRQSTKNLEDVYIESPVSGAKVPLRQIADLKPEWHPGEIIRRNGIPTLTVQSETTSEVLAAELLSEIKPKIEGLELPTGYQIEYGGEQANKSEVFGQMVMVIVISLIAIFLVLMLQFKNIKEVGLVMLTIPLTAFGAISGLYITGNDFGFTAFVGLISLSGIVVRNAIILIDHANELIKQGKDIKTAAIESGKRRLRPIFLTAMAAAIGVWPMILSGSQLWSPLASVIAFGVVWSMVISTLTIPVLYSLCITPKEKGQLLNSDGRMEINKTVPVAMLIAGLLLATPLVKAQTLNKPLSLIEIQEMAVENNRLLKIKQLQVNEKQQKVNEDRVKFFPVVAVNGNYQYNSELPALTIPAGSFGTLPMQYFMPNGTIQNVNVALPNEDKSFEMGQNNTYNGTATIYQPISQLPKISAGVNVSKTELEISRKEQEKATMQVKQTAEKLYYGILISLKQKEEAELKISVAKARLENAERALHAGKVTTSATVGLKAALADEEQNLLKITIQLEEYQADLSQLIGWSEPMVFTLQSLTNDELEPVLLTVDSLKSESTSANANIKLAELNKKKVDYAIRASNYSYLPDLGVLGGYMYQQGNKLLPENNTFVGVSFKWNIQDMVTTTYSRKQRVSQREQAEQNIAYTIEQVNTDMAKAERRIKQSMALISVARQVVEYRREDFKIQTDKQTSGLNIDTDYLTAKAALIKAESDLYAALLSYRIALTDMRILTGNY